MNPQFWQGRRVFLTGHTGFKGAWVSLWLARLGAQITGYALAAPTYPNLFDAAEVASVVTSIEGDVCDQESLRRAMIGAKPDIVIHLAAQALVRPSYADPRGTFFTNVMGTVNVLESMRSCEGICAAVIVTSDKCYENTGKEGYVEGDPLGGHDPYSSSKACAELVTAAYRRSFFDTGPAVASARAGNVIGGGDWARDRLVPDLFRGALSRTPVTIRNPDATRPWQHVLDALAGYLVLAERLSEDGRRHARAWNFGPGPESSVSVREIVDGVAKAFGGDLQWRIDAAAGPHEAGSLSLDPTLAHRELGWRSRLSLARSIEMTAQWYRDVYFSATPRRARDACLAQVAAYETA